MNVILEIDHTVSKEEVVNWIEEVLKPSTPCVWGYSFEEHHCGSCHNSQIEEENKQLKAQIENMQIMEYSNLYKQKKKLHKDLINDFTEQLGIMDKEEDVLFSLKEIKSTIDFIMELE